MCTFIYDSVNYGMQIVMSFLIHWLISLIFIEKKRIKWHSAILASASVCKTMSV